MRDTDTWSRRQIVDRGLGAELRMQRDTTALFDQARHLAVGIVEIAKGARHRRAVRHARRLLARAHAVAAKIAFHHDLGLVPGNPRLFVGRRALLVVVLRTVVVVAVAVGAGHHAGPTAHALVRIDVDNPILPLETRPRRTGIHAGRLLAVIAQHRQEQLPHCRILPLLLFENARVENTGRRAVLGFAGKLAGVATDTTLQVDHHAPSHCDTFAGVTLTRTQRSRLRLIGLAWLQSSSSSSLKNTPLPLATGIPSPQWPAQAAMPSPSGWMPCVSLTRPFTLRPASVSTVISAPSCSPFFLPTSVLIAMV